MYHSPHPCGDKEQASEIAARVALESLGILPGGHNVGNNRRGRGRGHHRGRDNPNQYQPWAKYSGHYPSVRQKSDNRELAGTDQMDIRYRDKQPDPKLSSSDPMMKEIDQKQQKVSKPAFVPLQVSRKAVKPVEKKVEEVKPEVAAVKSDAPEKVVTPSPRSSASKENTPQRSLSKGQSAPPKQGRKMRMAANFGGEGNQ